MHSTIFFESQFTSLPFPSQKVYKPINYSLLFISSTFFYVRTYNVSLAVLRKRCFLTLRTQKVGLSALSSSFISCCFWLFFDAIINAFPYAETKAFAVCLRTNKRQSVDPPLWSNRKLQRRHRKRYFVLALRVQQTCRLQSKRQEVVPSF